MFHKTVKLILKSKYVHTVNAFDWKMSIALCILRGSGWPRAGNHLERLADLRARVPLNISVPLCPPRDFNGTLCVIKRDAIDVTLKHEFGLEKAGRIAPLPASQTFNPSMNFPTMDILFSRRRNIYEFIFLSFHLSSR